MTLHQVRRVVAATAHGEQRHDASQPECSDAALQDAAPGAALFGFECQSAMRLGGHGLLRKRGQALVVAGSDEACLDDVAKAGSRGIERSHSSFGGNRSQLMGQHLADDGKLAPGFLEGAGGVVGDEEGG
ncbi:hypothetical protein D9M68_743960 [compost metagenome]